MTGFAFHLSALAGRLAVVIFGERDCANAFPRQQSEFLKIQPWHVYTTALRETDVMGGGAERVLDECLRAVIAGTAPRAVVVLSTCLTEMINADPEPVCRAVADQTGVRVVAVRTSGLKPRTQAEIADWVAAVLVDALGVPAPVCDVKAVNLVGYATGRSDRRRREERVLVAEARRILGYLGIRVNAAVPVGAEVADWEALPAAGLTVVSERAFFPQLAGRLEGEGRRVVEVASPKGVAATDAFYRRIALELGIDGRLADAAPDRARAAATVAMMRGRFGGLRLAYGLGSQHNFDADQLAHEGLGDLPMLQEAGFEVELVIQERDRPEAHERIRRSLDAAGVDVPYRLFYEPAVLAPVLRDGAFDAAYLADFLADQAAIAGVPMLGLGSLGPGYEGIEEAWPLLRHVFAAARPHRRT
jgi:hypothetical protein